MDKYFEQPEEIVEDFENEEPKNNSQPTEKVNGNYETYSQQIEEVAEDYGQNMDVLEDFKNYSQQTDTVDEDYETYSQQTEKVDEGFEQTEEVVENDYP